MNNRPLKIMLLPPPVLPVPAVQGGAIETLITLLAQENERQQQVVFYVPSRPDVQAKKQAQSFRYTHFIYIEPQPLRQKVSLNALRYSIADHLSQLVCHSELAIGPYYWRAFRLAKSLGCDYIIAEGGDYPFFSTFIEEFGPDQVYLHLHHDCTDLPNLNHIFSHVICVSEFLRRAWLSNATSSSGSAHVVHNAIDLSMFQRRTSTEERQQLRQEYGFSEQDTVAVFCGRLIPVKGALELVQAFQLLNHPSLRLWIIGTPNFKTAATSDYAARLEQFAARSGGRIRMTGYVDNCDLYRYYQSSDFQVVPSLCEEAAGLVAIEGMASGLPIIATRSGGLVEYVDTSCALLADRGPGLVTDLAHAMETLTTDTDLRSRMSLAARKRAEEFSSAKMYQAFLNVFRTEEIL